MNQESRIKKIKDIIHYSLFIIRKYKRGFTLIELLIVVSIIGILATLLLVNFIGIRQRARDASRKSDLKQIQSSLELYRSDQGVYALSLPSCGSSFQSPDGNTTYIQKIPCDPLGSPYTYSSNGNTYSIIACLENISDSQKDTTNVSPCNGTTSFSYTTTNP